MREPPRNHADRAIPFVDFDAQRRRLGSAIDRAIAQVLQHGRYVMGPEVGELEQRLADIAGVDHVVTCSSGTDALLLPLLAWGVGDGDAVFVPSFTFTATAEVVALTGATPVFCDVLCDTFNLNAESFAGALDRVRAEGRLKPRAVIPVDLFGQPADYDAIRPLASGADLLVLADAAQSFGAEHLGVRVGSLGHATATSFFPAKPLGCYGDGGAVLTNDGELADAMRSIRVHGQGTSKYETLRVGLNARLDTIQASILLAKLDIFEEELRERALVARRYQQQLADIVEVPAIRAGASSTWAQYTLKVQDRDMIAQRLNEAGVPTAVYYPKPLHSQPAFEGGVLAPDGCRTAETLCEEVLSLPMHPYLTDLDQDTIVSVLHEASTRGR